MEFSVHSEASKANEFHTFFLRLEGLSFYIRLQVQFAYQNSDSFCLPFFTNHLSSFNFSPKKWNWLCFFLSLGLEFVTLEVSITSNAEPISVRWKFLYNIVYFWRWSKLLNIRLMFSFFFFTVQTGMPTWFRISSLL